MIDYDPQVIQQFADQLYKRASSTVAAYAFIGLLIGCICGYFLRNTGGSINSAIASILTALIGFAIGREKAFKIKLQAQTALCQMKIEQNTSR